jgi:hypothetical protein
MKIGTYDEYEEKKAWIEDYIVRWEKHRGPEHALTEEDKERARKSLMESVQLH